MGIQKHIVVFTLVSLLFINYLGTNLMYGFYMINQEVFTELFCENKDKPDMECDGTCMLAKLSDHDRQDSEVPPLLDVFQVQLVFYIPALNFDFIPEFKEEKPQYFYQDLYLFEYTEQNFRPPILA